MPSITHLPLLLGFVGMPGAGKSTAIEVGREFAPVITMGDVVREETQRRNIPITSESLGRMAQLLREEEGVDVVAIRCISRITQIRASTIIIDGIRSMHEVQIFRKSYPLVVIAVIATDAQRHQWLLARKRGDDADQLDLIRKRDARELEFGIGEVIAQADFSIENTGSIEELQHKVRTLLVKRIPHIK